MAIRSLFAASPGQHAAGLAIVRVVAGIVFMMHGYQKLFTFGIAGVQGAFTQMGAPLPMITGPLVGALEFFGGIALIIGLLTRLVALGLVFDMLGAILLVHLAKGFFLPGYEFVLLLGTVALGLVVAGPGAYSVDEHLARSR
jgi:putative oxidoreductase